MGGHRCVVTLKRGREKPVLSGHPWIFSGAVASTEGYRQAGDLCTVIDDRRHVLASGYVNRGSRIMVRVLASGESAQEQIDGPFIRGRLEEALLLREALFGSSFIRSPRSAFRVVNTEGDFLPGLIVDRYGEALVLQALTAGMQRLKGLVVDSLRALFAPSLIYEKVDRQMAAAEGMDAASDSCLHGEIATLAARAARASLAAPAALTALEIEEKGARFRVDIPGGQKTGFYLDQRANRGILKDLSAGQRLLNCFSYTGAFGIQAALGGALSVHNVDLSEKALEEASQNAALNRIEQDRFTTEKADVFQFLRREESLYDIIVLDPPKFAASRGELQGALRGYKDINLQALRRLKPGGFLMSFSCSGLVAEELFQKVVFGAAVDAARPVRILRRLHADADHPVNIAHREGHYLKGLLLQVR